jgi:hypothetical protein
MTNPPRFQFSLRTVLAVVTLCAVVLAAVKTLGMKLVLGFSGLGLSCGFVLLLALALIPLDRAMSRLSYLASAIFTPFLYGALGFAFFIFGEAIDQPHPDYAEGNWLTRGAVGGISFMFLAAMGMLILVTIDAAVQGSRTADGAYYPRLANLWRGLNLLHVRLILIIGGTLIVGYYAMTVVEVWSSAQRPSGWQWPPKRVFLACHFLWGLLWLADCASRPRLGTMTAAIGYLLLSLLMLPMGFGVLRE